MTSTAPETVCVALVPPGGEGLDGFRASLDGESDRMLVHHHPELAMADLCVRERAGRTRTAWGLTPSASTTLAVVDPAVWPSLDRLLGAIERYLPAVRVVSWESGRLVELWPGRPAPPEGPVGGPEPSWPADHPDPTLDADETRVSGEEIAMLLDPEAQPAPQPDPHPEPGAAPDEPEGSER